MNLNEYMNQGIFQLVKTAGRFYLKNPRGIAFLAKIAPEIKKSAKRREAAEGKGLHIPPFLIASITSRCNLHCAGCYARAGGGCSDGETSDMTAQDWRRILAEASELGVSFALLAGGEPLLRRDVIEAAASLPNMVFPIFTNGTMLDETYLRLFERCRNLIPVFSLEGGKDATDERRGEGAYQTVEQAMRFLERKKILFGSSVTVTKNNMEKVTSREFAQEIRAKGCGILFLVEYVPVEPGTEHLMLDEDDIKWMQKTVAALREDFSDMVLVSFPGDEEETGGCLASGRGFFHINAQGGAEPCPFSPHSVLNLREHSLEEAVHSNFFAQLRELAARAGHDGGCTLFQHKEEVAALLNL